MATKKFYKETLGVIVPIAVNPNIYLPVERNSRPVAYEKVEPETVLETNLTLPEEIRKTVLSLQDETNTVNEVINRYTELAKQRLQNEKAQYW